MRVDTSEVMSVLLKERDLWISLIDTLVGLDVVPLEESIDVLTGYITGKRIDKKKEEMCISSVRYGKRMGIT